MVSRHFAPLSVGIGILVAISMIAFSSSEVPAVQADTSSLTLPGNLTSRGTMTASMPYDQISVLTEIWTKAEEKDPPVEKLELGATKAQGATLGSGCSYTLKFNAPNQVGELSYYSLVAETPKMNGKYVGHYRTISGSTKQFAQKYDLKF